MVHSGKTPPTSLPRVKWHFRLYYFHVPFHVCIYEMCKISNLVRWLSKCQLQPLSHQCCWRSANSPTQPLTYSTRDLAGGQGPVTEAPQTVPLFPRHRRAKNFCVGFAPLIPAFLPLGLEIHLDSHWARAPHLMLFLLHYCVLCIQLLVSSLDKRTCLTLYHLLKEELFQFYRLKTRGFHGLMDF